MSIESTTGGMTGTALQAGYGAIELKAINRAAKTGSKKKRRHKKRATVAYA